MGRLGSEVHVSVSFQSFASRMFVCPVMFLPSRLLSPVPERPFLPCTAMHKRGLCCHAVPVCVFVCVFYIRGLCQNKQT